MTADALRPDALPPEPTLAERWQRGIADLRYLVEHEHSHIRWIVAAYRMRQLAAILAAADITGDDYVRAEHAALLVIRALTPGGPLLLARLGCWAVVVVLAGWLLFPLIH